MTVRHLMWAETLALIGLFIANPLYLALIADSSHHNLNHYTFHATLQAGILIGLWLNLDYLTREDA